MKYYFTHAYSLMLGGMFKTAYWIFGMDNFFTIYFFERYKETRRLLPGVTRGPKGRSTMCRAYEAYESTQGKE
jgi:hypothetical protein